MTSSEWPAASSLRKARSSFAMSSKCRPVVGSSNRNSLPRCVMLESTRAGLGQVAGELQALRLAARERRHRLAELQVLQANVRQRRQARGDFARVGEEGARLGHGQLQHVGDVQAPAVRALAAHLEHLLAIAPAVAVRAAQVHVGEELHLDVLEAVAAAGRAAAVAGVEAESAGGVLALLRRGLGGEQLADRVEGADVARRVGARGAADRVLVDHDHIVDQLGAGKAGELPGRLGGLAAVLQQRRVQHVLHQRRLARAGDAGDAHQPLQRDAHVDVLQVVLAGALELQPAVGTRLRHHAAGTRRRPCAGGGRARRRHALAAAQVLAREGRLVSANRLRAAEEHDLAAALAGAGAEIQDAIGLEHDLRVVLDHDQRVARIAQPLHHPDHPLHVARMQADGGLIEHEQRVDERGAERGGEVDALHFAARERARLAIEREVAQADVREVAEAAADLPEQQIGCLIQRRGSCSCWKNSWLRSTGSSTRSWIESPGSAASCAALHSTPWGRKRGAAPSAASASALSPTRHSSASVFRRAPSQTLQGV